MRVHDTDTKLLYSLQGSNLDLALTREDYTVEIGPCRTHPTSIDSSYLYVLACDDLPAKQDHETKVATGACACV